MANQIRNPNDGGVFVRFLLLGAISLGASAACWWAAGNSLGLFFGGLFAATFLTPAAVLVAGNFYRAIGGLAAAVVPIMIVWLLPALSSADTPLQWMQAAIVLLTYSAVIGGIALVLERVKCPPVYSVAVAVVIGLAWLTWPVWLSANLVKSGLGGIAQNLVALHPPLVINGILTNEPAWTERSLAYHLTDLNQDVPIQLPASAGKCATLHGILGLALWSAARVGQRKAETLVLKTSATRLE
jgi:hypothetical protein